MASTKASRLENSQEDPESIKNSELVKECRSSSPENDSSERKEQASKVRHEDDLPVW